MTIRFYSWPRSSGTRVHWALEELGIAYDLVLVDAANKEHKSPEYLAINPNGKVPALVDDGVTYFESLAILLHLAHAYGVDRGVWPAATDRQAHADALCWATWAHTELWAYMIQYVYHGLDAPMSYKPADRSAAAAAWSLHNFDAQLDMLEGRLTDRDHVLGDFSLVDVPIASVLSLGKRLGVALGDHPKLQAWLARCTARPALQRAR